MTGCMCAVPRAPAGTAPCVPPIILAISAGDTDLPPAVLTLISADPRSAAPAAPAVTLAAADDSDAEACLMPDLSLSSSLGVWGGVRGSSLPPGDSGPRPVSRFIN